MVNQTPDQGACPEERRDEGPPSLRHYLVTSQHHYFSLTRRSIAGNSQPQPVTH